MKNSEIFLISSLPPSEWWKSFARGTSRVERALVSLLYFLVPSVFIYFSLQTFLSVQFLCTELGRNEKDEERMKSETSEIYYRKAFRLIPSGELGRVCVIDGMDIWNNDNNNYNTFLWQFEQKMFEERIYRQNMNHVLNFPTEIYERELFTFESPLLGYISRHD